MGPLILRHCLNTALMVLTLGVYRFWAITVMRRLMWWRTSLDGQRFEYTGNGLEIFIGFLKVFLCVLLPIGLAIAAIRLTLETQATAASLEALQVVDGVYAVLVFLLIELGRFLSWRYRVARTRWRGIRSRIDMRVPRYFAVALGSATMLVFSVWLLKPVVDVLRARTLINNLDVGGVRATLDLSLTRLVPAWLLFVVVIALAYTGLVAWIVLSSGIIQTLAVSATEDGSEAAGSIATLAAFASVFLVPLLVVWGYSAYRAAFWRHVCANARVGPLCFRFTGTATGLFWLSLTNIAIYVFSLTLLAPVTWRRRLDYAARHLTIIGRIDPQALHQIPQDESAVGGEGLAGDFDLA
jgi:uncharacterized membrane protein YjgN (DUF898 family)